MFRFIFMVIVTVGDYFNLDQRFMDKGSDWWAHFVERANITLWPSYDGETWSEFLLG